MKNMPRQPKAGSTGIATSAAMAEAKTQPKMLDGSSRSRILRRTNLRPGR